MEPRTFKSKIPENSLHERKDARKYFGRGKNLVAQCVTPDNVFNEYIQDLSSGGVFIRTARQLPLGGEIAMTIPLPDSRKTLKATGEIVRTSPQGVGVEFKVFFNY
jgi:Tfp pilus assembly protein PilZ